MSDRIIYTPREIRPPKRDFKKIFFISLIGAVFIILSWGLIHALRKSSWQIKNIYISGLRKLDEGKIRSKIQEALGGNYALIIPNSSFFLIDEKNISSTLEKEFPQIDFIVISKEFPDRIVIEIRERDLWTIFCIKEDKSCVYMDKSGFGYETAPLFSGFLITKIKSDFDSVTVPSQILDSGLTERMIFLSRGLQNEIGERTIGYEISKDLPREFKLTVSSGYTLYFNRYDNFPAVFKVLKTVLDKEIKDKRSRLEYIDLRFGNKVFYKWQRGTK